MFQYVETFIFIIQCIETIQPVITTGVGLPLAIFWFYLLRIFISYYKFKFLTVLKN